MQKNSYIEQCIDTLRQIRDSGQLAQHSKTGEVGRSRTFATYSLGSVALVAGDCYLGVKQPLAREGVMARLHAELPVFASIVEGDSELRAVVPTVVGCLSIDHYRRTYLLVEDASENGSVAVTSAVMSDELFTRMQSTTIMAGGELHQDARAHTAFQAGSVERILDGTPSPFRRVPSHLAALREDVERYRSELVIDIPPDSPLARSL